jgi:hypothetical protein
LEQDLVRERSAKADAAETLDVRGENDENSKPFERFGGKRSGWLVRFQILLGLVCRPGNWVSNCGNRPFLKVFEGGVIRPCSIQLAMQ